MGTNMGPGLTVSWDLTWIQTHPLGFLIAIFIEEAILLQRCQRLTKGCTSLHYGPVLLNFTVCLLKWGHGERWAVTTLVSLRLRRGAW